MTDLKIIHIAGTKGKGSTCAFVSSILQQYSVESPGTPQVGHVGLYSSPHLRSVRERIRLNGAPLSESDFARFFFDVWDRLESSFKDETPVPAPPGPRADAPLATLENPQPKPVYFRYLTLMGLHAYKTLHSADQNGLPLPVVLEVGLGGEHDSTNVVDSPSVTAISSLGIDHVAVLGNTIDKIAWHKAGIFKRDSLYPEVFTVPQPEPAMAILQERATDAGKTLRVVATHPEIASGAVPLGLAGEFQRINASLAVACAAAWLRTHFPTAQGIPTPGSAEPLPDAFKRGLAAAHWGGRCETRPDKHESGLTWHLDGGHTAESLALAGAWFAECQTRLQKKGKRVLVFNQQTRDAPALARTLHASLRSALSGPGCLFDVAVFCTNVTFKDAARGYKADLVSMNASQDAVKALDVQRELAGVWAELDEGCDVKVAGTIQDALELARGVARGAETAVLVTGSLHLVGGALEVLEEGEDVR